MRDITNATDDRLKRTFGHVRRNVVFLKELL